MASPGINSTSSQVECFRNPQPANLQPAALRPDDQKIQDLKETIIKALQDHFVTKNICTRYKFEKELAQNLSEIYYLKELTEKEISIIVDAVVFKKIDPKNEFSALQRFAITGPIEEIVHSIFASL